MKELTSLILSWKFNAKVLGFDLLGEWHFGCYRWSKQEHSCFYKGKKMFEFGEICMFESQHVVGLKFGIIPRFSNVNVKGKDWQ